MKIEINRNLFLACMGLVLSGDDSYDHRDADLSHLADRIRPPAFPATPVHGSPRHAPARLP